MPDDSMVIERVAVRTPITAATRKPNDLLLRPIGVVVLLLGLTVACPRTPHLPIFAGRPECRHHPGHPTIAGRYTPVPEYHDCQRLVVKSGTSLVYGRMGALFLSEAVIEGQITAVSYTGIGPGNGGTQVFTPVVISDGLPMDSAAVATGVTGTGAGTVVIPWVQVVADSDYLDLGVQQGFNCMYFRAFIDNAGNPIALDAKMVFADPRRYKPCGDAALMARPGVPLKVTVNGSGRVPTATRWDWSETDQLHIIGVPCPIAPSTSTTPVSGPGTSRIPRGTAASPPPLRSRWVPTKWCDVGAPTSIGSVPHGTTPYQKAVKGWSDEQYLADPSEGSLARTDIMGTVFPDAGLDTRPVGFYNDAFKTAAFVALRVITPGPTTTAALEKYRQRFGFDAVSPSAGFNRMGTIALCFGLESRCLEGVPEADRPNCSGDANDSRWWARTQNEPEAAAERLTRYHCVTYRGHPGEFKMPGMVRWRFHPNPGETNWIPCLPNGCCEVEG